MKERLITFAMAVAALLLVGLMLLPSRAPDRHQLSLPTSEDTGVNGMKGLMTWLSNAQIPVVSLRKRYLALFNPDTFAPSGNLLIITLPHFRRALDSEWQALTQWIANGNTLFVLGYTYNQAHWTRSESWQRDVVMPLLANFGWQFTLQEGLLAKIEDQEADSLKQRIDQLHARLSEQTPTAMAIDALSTLPLMASVDKLESNIVPDLLDRQWKLSTGAPQLALRLFFVNDRIDHTVQWQIEAGKGQVFLSMVGDIFSNAMLNHAGNARFFKNLLGQVLSDDGQVIFDDYHFGLSDLYDPERFFHDQRLHYTLYLLLMFWLLYVLGYSNRLAPVHSSEPRVAVIDTVEAMAGFFARRLNKKILAYELTRRLLQDIAEQRRLPDDAAVWLWLQRHPQIPQAHVARLRQAIDRQNIQLNNLIDILSEIRLKTLS